MDELFLCRAKYRNSGRSALGCTPFGIPVQSRPIVIVLEHLECFRRRDSPFLFSHRLCFFRTQRSFIFPILRPLDPLTVSISHPFCPFFGQASYFFFFSVFVIVPDFARLGPSLHVRFVDRDSRADRCPRTRMRYLLSPLSPKAAS